MSNAVSENIKTVAIAKFQRPHGVKGQILVQSFSSPEEKLFSYPQFFLKDNTEIFFKKGTKHKNGFIITVQGYDDRDQVGQLVNQEIFIHRSEFDDIKAEDEFYIVDLEGLDVKNHNGEKVGIINAMLNYGAGDIVEIKFSDASKTELFTFDKYHFPEISIDEGFVVFTPTEEILVQEQEE